MLKFRRLKTSLRWLTKANIWRGIPEGQTTTENYSFVIDLEGHRWLAKVNIQKDPGEGLKVNQQGPRLLTKTHVSEGKKLLLHPEFLQSIKRITK